MEEEVPASERDEVYQRLQDALIHYDPPDTLGRGNFFLNSSVRMFFESQSQPTNWERESFEFSDH